MISACKNCGGFLMPGKIFCQRCGHITADAASTGTVGAPVKDDDFIDATDVMAQSVARLVTGGPWDEAWGGGFVPSSITLLGGAPGSGKTTMLLQLSILLAKLTSKPTYYISAEQDKGELKLTIDRLGLPLERGSLRMLKNFGAGGSIDESTFTKAPPGMIILDSISALCGNDKHTQIAICKRYKQYAVKHSAPTFLIAHMTKEHDFAGLMALQHEVDTLVTLFPEDDGMRHLKAWKNRYGPTHAEYRLLMTEQGLVTPPKKPDKKMRKLLGIKDAPPEEAPGPLEEPSPRERKPPKPPPDEIVVDGQKLVRKKKGAKAGSEEPRSKGGKSKGDKPPKKLEKTDPWKPARAAAIEGDAPRRKRPAVKRTKEALKAAKKRRKERAK
jgi:hypothetical protein